MIPDPAVANYLSENPLSAGPNSLAGRAVHQRRTLHVHDVEADPALDGQQALAADVRTVLQVPLLREGEPIGVLSLLKTKVEPFTDKQIELVTTFIGAPRLRRVSGRRRAGRKGPVRPSEQDDVLTFLHYVAGSKLRYYVGFSIVGEPTRV
jgi:GAF domain